MDADALVALAESFWERVGCPPPWPRELEPVIPQVAPVWVVPLADLSPGTAQDWLRRRGLDLPLGLPERPLDGCILAFRGQAVVFVADGLPADERRVVVAHEFAHYLAEYERPRERVTRRLGREVEPLLDGVRPATPVETWAAALAGIRLDAHVHYMERTFGRRCPPAVAAVERTANALACELLAPRHAVREVVGRDGLCPDDRAAWQRLLAETFGLPPRWAAVYAGRLLAEGRRRRSFCDRFGL
jgi:hypothetical protein